MEAVPRAGGSPGQVCPVASALWAQEEVCKGPTPVPRLNFVTDQALSDRRAAAPRPRVAYK